ncbi:MAG: hypothetical protein ACK5MA_08820 [Parachlamydiaceae bacterium]
MINPTNSLFSIFKNRWAAILLLIILLQQLLVAGGTYFLGEITREFPLEGFQLSTAFYLFVCTFLPGTIIHYLVSWSSLRTYKSSQSNYLEKYIQSNYNHPTHWRNEYSKQQRHDIMCRGGQDTILSTVNFFGDVSATGLNITLNTISIILVTNFSLGLVILISGSLGLSIIFLKGTKISETSRNEMLADNQLNAHLSKSWDNIILGNQLFFDRWKSHFNKLFSKSEKESVECVKQREWTISMAGMVTNALVLGYALFLAWMNQNDVGFVLAILVMLPRSLQIVMHIQIIQIYLAQWTQLKERLKITHESILEPSPIDLNHLIQENKINVEVNNKIHSLLEIENMLNKHTTGRFTITGENGVGKSSLLLKLNNKYPCSSTYLPAHHQLMLCEMQLGLSTGEIALASLKDIQSSNCKVLLLDEWDANLSADKRATINQLINQLSSEKIVIEIRHLQHDLKTLNSSDINV